MMGMVSLLEDTPKREINFFSRHVKQGKTCEHIAKRQLSTSQELNGLVPWTWTSCPLNYEKLHFCCLSHPVLSIFTAAWAKTHTHTHTHTHLHVLIMLGTAQQLGKVSHLEREGSPWTLGPDGLGLNPSPATSSCVPLSSLLLCASVSPYVKWEWSCYYFIGLLWGLTMLMGVTCLVYFKQWIHICGGAIYVLVT